MSKLNEYVKAPLVAQTEQQQAQKQSDIYDIALSLGMSPQEALDSLPTPPPTESEHRDQMTDQVIFYFGNMASDETRDEMAERLDNEEVSNARVLRNIFLESLPDRSGIPSERYGGELEMQRWLAVMATNFVDWHRVAEAIDVQE